MKAKLARKAGSFAGRVLVLALLILAVAPLATHPARAATPDQGTLTLTPSQPSGVAAGTPIGWTAMSDDPHLCWPFGSSARSEGLVPTQGGIVITA